MKKADKPMKITCGARTRAEDHHPCKLKPCSSNGRCKFHGGKSPIKHGRFTKDAIAERKRISAFLKRFRDDIDDFETMEEQ